jgi:hypothetical protein
MSDEVMKDDASGPYISRQIYRLHLGFYGRTNDTHILLQRSLPNLLQIRRELKSSNHKKDRKYYTPKMNRRVFSRRKDDDVVKFFDRYIETEIYQGILVAIVSNFEVFLIDCLQVVLRRFPRKLTIDLDGSRKECTVSFDLVLSAENHESLI